MRLLVGLCLATTLLLAIGCPPSNREPDLSAILGEPEPLAVVDDLDPAEFDFGSILARDQTLRHEFRVANRSDRVLRVLGSKVKVPCCSSLGDLPGSIAPGGEATIPVFLKVGHVADRKRVAFELETDSPTRTIRTLSASARFVPDWEVEESREDRGPVKIGQSSKRTCRVIGRRKAGEGRRAPTEVVASGDIELESTSAISEIEGSDGIIESSRVVTIKLPVPATSGEKSGTLTYRWPDGSSRIQEVRWSIKPSLQLSPSALVLRPETGPIEVSIEVQSEDRPFRVIQVSGSLLTGEVPPSDRAETTQHLRIKLDPGRIVPGVKPAIEITTDHTNPTTLTLSVLVLPLSKKGSE